MKGFKILLVDDQENVRNVTARLIRREFPEIEVTEANGLTEAVERMKETKFNMLITDYQLGDGNGNQVAEQFDQHGAPGAMRIGISGAHLHLFRSPEITFVMHKPFESKELYRHIIAAFKSRTHTENNPDL